MFYNLPEPVPCLIYLSPSFAVIFVDVSGKVIYSQKIEGTTPIDISNVENGVYILRFSNDNESFTRKLIIK